METVDSGFFIHYQCLWISCTLKSAFHEMEAIKHLVRAVDFGSMLKQQLNNLRMASSCRPYDGVNTVLLGQTKINYTPQKTLKPRDEISYRATFSSLSIFKCTINVWKNWKRLCGPVRWCLDLLPSPAVDVPPPHDPYKRPTWAHSSRPTHKHTKVIIFPHDCP